MSALRPRSQLETHDVFNQPPPFEDVNLFTSDVALQAAVAASGGEMHAERLSAFGARTGSAETAAWAMQANENSPRLKVFDHYGRRIDEVEFHPAYHRLMTLGVEAGVSSAAWSGAAAGHVLHAGLEFLMAQAEPGVCCPMTMTAAAPAALRCQPDIAARWMPKIVASRYDPSSQPMHGKSGVTIGMAMTEKQGLYDPAYEHDACGIGFVAHIHGVRSRDVVSKSLELLKNLTHRSAIAADGCTGDGAGILLGIVPCGDPLKTAGLIDNPVPRDDAAITISSQACPAINPVNDVMRL